MLNQAPPALVREKEVSSAACMRYPDTRPSRRVVPPALTTTVA